jgi:hypothetical protein
VKGDLSNEALFDALFDENLVEETFCDRFAAGAFYHRAALDGREWSEIYILLRCLQEAKRLMTAAGRLGHECLSDTLPTARRTMPDAIVERGISKLHLRTFMASGGLRDYAATIFRKAGSMELDDTSIEEVGGRLMSQSLAVFTFYAGPVAERTVILLLKAVAAKARDPDVWSLFETAVRRYDVTDDIEQKTAFERIVKEVSLDLIQRDF